MDPLTPANDWLRGMVKWADGGFETALQEFRSFVDKDATNPLALYFVGATLTRLGRGDEAEPFWEAVREVAPGGVHDKIIAVYKPAIRGDTDAVKAALTPEVREVASWHFGIAGDLATVCALGGAPDEALELLANAIDLGWLHADFFAKHDPSFKALYGDERFERLIEKARQKAAAFQE